jgi:hypothetical protein
MKGGQAFLDRWNFSTPSFSQRSTITFFWVKKSIAFISCAELP